VAAEGLATLCIEAEVIQAMRSVGIISVEMRTASGEATAPTWLATTHRADAATLASFGQINCGGWVTRADGET
jgi:hypothetical protein